MSIRRQMQRSRDRELKKVLQLPTPLVLPAPTAGPTVPVSVCIIAKEAAESLTKTLTSLKKLFVRPGDEILVLDTGSKDEGATVKVATQFGARVLIKADLCHDLRPYVAKWLPDRLDEVNKGRLANGSILDFSAARQIAADFAKHDVQFWIDADDELVEQFPGRLRMVVDKVFAGPDSKDVIFLDYHYSHDVDGSLASVLKRERIYDRRVYYWKGRCHETAIPRDWNKVKGAAYFADIGSFIRHGRPHTEDRSADIRNYIILRKELEETKGATDPRTTFYVGNAARGLSRNGEAIEAYQELLLKSGSRDDRHAAAYYIGLIYCDMRVRRPLDSLEWFQKCQLLKPEDPRGYFGMSRAYFQLGRWQECIHWFRIGSTLPEPTQSLHTYSPLQINAMPYQLAALAFKELGLRNEACECVERLRQTYPNSPDTKAIMDNIGNWVAGKELVESIRRVVVNSTPKTPDEALAIGRRLIEPFQDVPDELEDGGMAKLELPDTRAGKDLVIFCGRAIEGFGPRSGALGLGGSEKAVVMMAPRLQKRGYRVTVYGNVPRDQRGIDSQTGVNWQHYGSFDKSRARGTIIYWRAPEALEFPFAAKQRIVWCHDVQDARRWTDPRIALVDQVWVLSEFHASTLGEAREKLGSKVVITRNGIDVDLFKKYFGVARDPKKVIFASSPDRGVLSAIDLFKRATNLDGSQGTTEKIEGATLHIYYGFNKLYLQQAAQNEYRHIPDLGRDASMYDYMETVFQTCDNVPGIIMHGRVSWEVMAKEMCGAGVWLYPTRFDEISCMSAMEAGAAGLIHVCTRRAALAETVVSSLDPTVQNLQDALHYGISPDDDEGRQISHDRACRRFDYETLADEWCKLIG